MGSFTHKGISFHYEEWGEGIPFLFLHGLGNDCAYVYENIDRQDGVRLIALDQEGHGRSGFCRESLSFDALGEDALALADHLGLARFYLGGLSMGAGVSVNVALRCPKRLRGLILVRPAWLAEPMQEPVRTCFGLLAQTLPLADGKERFMQEPAVRELLRERPESAPAFLNHFEQEASRRRPEKFAVMPGCRPFADEKRLASLAVPTLVAACRQDLVHPFAYGEWYAGRIPGAQLLELPAKSVDAAGYHRELNRQIGRMLGVSTGAAPLDPGMEKGYNTTMSKGTEAVRP